MNKNIIVAVTAAFAFATAAPAFANKPEKAEKAGDKAEKAEKKAYCSAELFSIPPMCAGVALGEK